MSAPSSVRWNRRKALPLLVSLTLILQACSFFHPEALQPPPAQPKASKWSMSYTVSRIPLYMEKAEAAQRAGKWREAVRYWQKAMTDPFVTLPELARINYEQGRALG